MKNKQLKRSNKNKILFGVIGGLAEYFEIDVVLARLGFITLLVITGFFPFGLVYVLALIIIPEENNKSKCSNDCECNIDCKNECKNECKNNHDCKNEEHHKNNQHKKDGGEVIEAKFVDNK